MSIAAGLFLLAHGAAHLVGFLGRWRLSPKVPFKPTLLAGRVTLSEGGSKVLGAGWLLMAMGFAAAALGAFVHAGGWQRGAGGIAALSLVLCLLELPEAKIGAILNVVIIAAVLALGFTRGA
jgi:hypothetical protein